MAKIAAETPEQFKAVQDFMNAASNNPDYWKMYSLVEWNGEKRVLLTRDIITDNLVVPMDVILDIRYKQEKDKLNIYIHGKMKEYIVNVLVNNVVHPGNVFITTG